MAPPFRRAVFFFAGFDDIGVRFYYGLFRRGMARAFAQEKRRHVISKPVSVAETIAYWRVDTHDGESDVTIDYYFLTVRHLARASQPRDAFRALAAWAFTAYAFLGRGVLFRIFRHYLPGALVLTYALMSLPFYFALGAGAGWLSADWAGAENGKIKSAAALLAGLAALQIGLYFDRRTFANFLLSAMRFAAAHALGRTRALEELNANWAQFIAEKSKIERWNEVMMVGHSNGATSACDVTARLRRVLPPGAPLSLLTLGSTDCLVSYFRTARRHREALAELATAPDLVWVQYYSPWDFINLGARDPVIDAGIDLGGRPRRGPRLAILDFDKVLSPQSFRRIGFDLFQRHFQYLRANDRPDGYCYFRMVAAGRPLS